MDRREVLKYTALMTGAAISAPLLGALVTGCHMEEAAEAMEHVPGFFSEDEFALLRSLVDTIIPVTDSPSASQVGVHRIIDHIVGAVYKEADKRDYQKSFTALAEYLNAAEESSFIQLEPDQQLHVLLDLDQSPDESLAAVRKAYLDVRQQTVAFYLSTEKIAEQYLNYLPIPGKYEACISLSEVGGKVWAI